MHNLSRLSKTRPLLLRVLLSLCIKISLRLFVLRGAQSVNLGTVKLLRRLAMVLMMFLHPWPLTLVRSRLMVCLLWSLNSCKRLLRTMTLFSRCALLLLYAA